MTRNDTTIDDRPQEVSVAETARLLRGALKREFPDARFKVRSAAHRAAIHVHWTDGPVDSDVRAITSRYEGGGFDPTVDLSYTVHSWLEPDGSTSPASSYGGGTVASFHELPPSPDAKLVHFGAQYIFTVRQDSPDAMRDAIERVAERWGLAPEDRPVVKEADDGGCYLLNDKWVNHAQDYSTNLVRREADRTVRP